MSISRSLLLRCGALLAGGLFLCGPGTAPAAQTQSAPQAVVESFDSDLLAAMRQAGSVGPKGRFDILAPSVARAFDMNAMTERMLKARWSHLTEEQKGRLAAAFGRFEAAQYAAWFDTFTGQSFQVGAAHPAPGGGTAVPSTMSGGGGPALALEYIVAEEEGGWKIVDIRYNGWMSDVERRASEFNAILTRSGVDALVARLDAVGQSVLARGDNRAAPHLLQSRIELWSVPLPAID